jgi:predicted aminopeptidase
LEGEKSLTLKKIREENEDEELFTLFIKNELEELSAFYEKNKNTTNEKQKQDYMLEIKRKFTEKVSKKLKTNSYNGFSSEKLNNASLLLYRTYLTDYSDFEKAFNFSNKDISKFLNFCTSLKNEKDPSKALKEKLALFPTL